MSKEKIERIRELRREANKLELELENEKEIPKTVNYYLHSNKDENYDFAIDNELNLNEKALRNFVYTAYEVKLTVNVYEDGSVWVTHFEDYKFDIPVKIN